MKLEVIRDIIYAQVIRADGKVLELSYPTKPMVVLVGDVDLSKITQAQWAQMLAPFVVQAAPHEE